MADVTRDALEIVAVDAALPILGWCILAAVAVGAIWLLEGELASLFSSTPTDTSSDAGTVVDEAAAPQSWGVSGIGAAAALRSYQAGKMTGPKAAKEAVASLPLWMYGFVLVAALLSGAYLVRKVID
jgi:hypothetical protein